MEGPATADCEFVMLVTSIPDLGQSHAAIASNVSYRTGQAHQSPVPSTISTKLFEASVKSGDQIEAGAEDWTQVELQ